MKTNDDPDMQRFKRDDCQYKKIKQESLEGMDSLSIFIDKKQNIQTDTELMQALISYLLQTGGGTSTSHRCTGFASGLMLLESSRGLEELRPWCRLLDCEDSRSVQRVQ